MLLRLISLLAFAWLAAPTARAQGRSPDLVVFAAASLTDVMEELSADWQKSSGRKVRLSFAASSVLARQIEAGGAADVFVSADQEWMEYLAARDLIAQPSRRNLAGNRLVLIAPGDSRVALTIARGFDLAGALGSGRLATADPDTVPLGRYARAALGSLGVWDSVSGKLVRADNARSALTYVARGEAPLGIVYATDAAAESRVRVVGVFPAGSHAPVTYPAAALSGAGAGALAYLDFLGSARAASVWKKHGFVVE
jgi:molybdate transport system substrate-binding protein